MFSDTLSFTASSQHEGQLSLKANPVTDHNDIYEAYLALRDPSFLRESKCKPNFPVHICREHCGNFFWIPCDQGQLFLELVLKTSMMCGAETIPPPAYMRTIVKIAKVEQADEGAINAWLQFNESVPNGSATMVFSMDGRKLRLKLRHYGEPQFGEDKVPNPGDDTKYLVGQWIPKDTGFGPDDLIQKSVSIYSDDYPAIGLRHCRSCSHYWIKSIELRESIAVPIPIGANICQPRLMSR